MTKFKIMLAAALLAASSLHALSASEKEEEVASRSAAILLLAINKCGPSKFDSLRAMDQLDTVYSATGVNPANYPEGEWTRKIFFTMSQTDFLRKVRDDDPPMVKAFCSSIAERFPNKD